MDFLVEELDRIIGDLTKIRDNLKNGIDLGRMKELCAERHLELECYQLEYTFNNPPPRGVDVNLLWPSHQQILSG